MKSLMLGIAFLVLLLSTQQAESFSVVPEDCMPACHNEREKYIFDSGTGWQNSFKLLDLFVIILLIFWENC